MTACGQDFLNEFSQIWENNLVEYSNLTSQRIYAYLFTILTYFILGYTVRQNNDKPASRLNRRPSLLTVEAGKSLFITLIIFHSYITCRLLLYR